MQKGALKGIKMAVSDGVFWAIDLERILVGITPCVECLSWVLWHRHNNKGGGGREQDALGAPASLGGSLAVTGRGWSVPAEQGRPATC